MLELQLSYILKGDHIFTNQPNNTGNHFYLAIWECTQKAMQEGARQKEAPSLEAKGQVGGRNVCTCPGSVKHHGDVIMDAIESQITSLTIVYSTVYSDADQRKHQSSASLAFVRSIHWGPMNSPHKWPVTRKSFHLVTSSWSNQIYLLQQN